MSIQAKQSLSGSVIKSTASISASINDRRSLSGVIAEKEKLSGTITNVTPKLVGNLNSKTEIRGEVSTKNPIAGSIAISDKLKYEYYKGSYKITPSIEQQVANTKGYLMEDDMTVRAIPYAEVTNSAGGTTVTIGG